MVIHRSGLVRVTASTGRTEALDWATGRPRWSLPGGADRPPAGKPRPFSAKPGGDKRAAGPAAAGRGGGGAARSAGPAASGKPPRRASPPGRGAPPAKAKADDPKRTGLELTPTMRRGPRRKDGPKGPRRPPRAD